MYGLIILPRETYHFLLRRAEWRHMEAIQTKAKTIEIRDATNLEARDKLEVRDRIIKFALGWNQVIVATSVQCYIYKYDDTDRITALITENNSYHSARKTGTLPSFSI